MADGQDPFASLPPNFREAIAKMISDTVATQVKEQVAEQMTKVNEEVKTLQAMLKESIATKAVANTSTRAAPARPGSSMGIAGSKTAEPKPTVNRLAKPAPVTKPNTSRAISPNTKADTNGSTSARGI